MTLIKSSNGKNLWKRKGKSLVRRIFFSFLFFLIFFAGSLGNQFSSTTKDSLDDGFSPDNLDIFPKASIGPTIENLTKTDPLELGSNAIVTADINHTDNGVDTVLIEIAGTNFSMSFVSGNEYSYTWLPGAVGNIPFTIFANATTIGDFNTLVDSIDVEDTTDPSLTNLNEFSGDPVEYNGAIEIRVDATDLLLDEVWIVFDGENYSMSVVSGDTFSYTNSSLGLGTYAYTVYANDTEGNLASTASGDITVEDSNGPSLSNLNEFSGDPVEYNNGIEIRIDVTDLLLDDVWIVFDGENYTMSPVSGDTYSYTNNSLVLGTYNYRIYANDTEGNLASSAISDITVEDTTDPILSVPNEFSGDPVEYNNGIEIRVDATDLLLDEVWIVFDGETYAMTPVSGDTYSYTNGTLALGTYGYTIYADDTTGNTANTLAYDITVEDTTDPVLSIPNEFSGDPVEYNNGIEIRVDATDLLLDEVWIVFDGETYAMTPVSGDTYSYTNGTLALGTYGYTIYADDTTGNTANTLAYDITVEDTTDPVLSIPNEFSGDPVEYNNGIEIRVDATDLLLDEVWIVFDGETYAMTPFSGDTYSYTNNSLVLGTYGYTIYANDTTGNTANTLAYDITVEDTTDPILSVPNEFSGDPVEYNGAIEIRVDATDLLLDEVWIVFDGETYAMTPLSGDTYSYTNASLALGTYSYTIYADDTTGNTANTLAYDITVEDTTDPVLSIPNEFSGDPVEYDNGIEIRVDATDLLLDEVWIVFDGETYSMSLVGGDTYTYTNNSLAIGTYSYTIYADDTTGNTDNTLTYDITVEDTTGPTINNVVEVSNDPVEFNGIIYIRVNITDLSPVDSVWIDFGGTLYDMNYISDDMYFYTANPAVNVYSYTIYANDTYGNEDNTIAYTITVEDTTAPTINNIVEVSNDPVEFNGAIYIRVNVTDLSPVDSVWIDFGGTLYDMNYISDDMYYYTTNPAVNVYSYTIYANDTYGNEDNTIAYTITVEDTTAPSLNTLNEASGDPTELGTDIDIRITVTDLSTIDTVWITFGGTDYTMSHMGSGVYQYTATHGVGTYAYTIYANDTYGNQDSQSGPDIQVSDTGLPSIVGLNEVSGDPTEYGTDVDIQITVTDLSGIDEVWIDFDGTNYSMALIGVDLYQYTATHPIGTYTYRIYANDTDGNEDYLDGPGIEVADTTGPSLAGLNEVSGDPVEFGDDVEIEITVTDLSTIDTVWINFAGTDYTMTSLGLGVYSYTASHAVGTHAYIIYANDTYGNQDSHAGPDIEVSDTTAPTLSGLSEVSGDPTELGTDVEIQITITDLSSIDTVWVNFLGTDYEMNHLGAGVYNYSAPHPIGTHAYTIYANDTYGNQDSLVGPDIEVSDTAAPSLSLLTEVSGDPTEYATAIEIQITVTDYTGVDSVWISIAGTNYTMNHLGSGVYNYSAVHPVGTHSYIIYANDTNGYEATTTVGSITVEDYNQSMIIFDISDYPVANMTADTDFSITFPFDDNTTLDWAKVYFKIETNLHAATPIDWTAITLVNGQATISSEYFDEGEILSYYFEIKDTNGVTFYVSSSGISTSNSTAQSDPFSFYITASPPPPFDFMKFLPYFIGGVVALAAAVAVYVGVKKAATKREYRDFPELKEAGDTAKALLEQQKIIQKEAIQAEKAKDYYTASGLYEKLIIIANELFKFGKPGATDSIKHYKAKIAKFEEKIQNAAKPGTKQAIQQTAAEYQKLADEAERTNDFRNALVIYHQILMLREEIKDKSQISSAKAKIKDIITEIPDIRETCATILKEAEEKYKAGEYTTAYADYRYLKTIFVALGDKNLINYIEKLITDTAKLL